MASKQEGKGGQGHEGKDEGGSKSTIASAAAEAARGGCTTTMMMTTMLVLCLVGQLCHDEDEREREREDICDMSVFCAVLRYVDKFELFCRVE